MIRSQKGSSYHLTLPTVFELCLDVYNPDAYGKLNQLGYVLYAKLFHDFGTMGLDCTRAYV